MNHLELLGDEELLNLLKEDNQLAFSCIYERYWKKALAVALNKTGSVADAENITQDIFVSLWNRRKSLALKGNLNNYLMVSVKYQVIKWLARQYRLRQYTDNVISIDLLDDSTREYLDFTELNQKLQGLLDQLPEQPKLIYKLYKEDGKSYKEIASELGITEKSVDSYLNRTKKILRTKLRQFLSLYLLP